MKRSEGNPAKKKSLEARRGEGETSRGKEGRDVSRDLPSLWKGFKNNRGGGGGGGLKGNF